MRRSAWSFHLGSGLLLAGFAGLGFASWAPWAAGHRTARIEGRAETIGAALHAVVRATQPLDLDDPIQRRHILARTFALTVAAGELTDDLTELPPTRPRQLLLANKHYVFAVQDSPPPAELATGPGAIPAIEVVVWPAEVRSPAHTAFFWPETAEAASTRNLQAAYAGSLHAPVPAGPHRRRNDASNHHPWAYRGQDDERWLVSRRPAGLAHARTRP